MFRLFNTPTWFHGWDIVIESVSIIVALLIALSTAVVAAKGVDFLVPLNPLAPAEPQTKARPSLSVIVIKELLKDAEI